MTNMHRIRKALGMNQTEFARAVRVSQATVSRWERGVQFPSYAAAKRIAALSNVPVDDLVRAA